VSQQSKKPTGRPKLPEEKSRSEFLSTRVSPEERDEIEGTIKRSGKSKTAWIRETLLAATRKKV
jgi:hypothetical protein